MLDLLKDKDFSDGFNMACAIECEEYQAQEESERTCPHCETVWEDRVAMLTCPCQDDYLG